MKKYIHRRDLEDQLNKSSADISLLGHFGLYAPSVKHAPQPILALPTGYGMDGSAKRLDSVDRIDFLEVKGNSAAKQ